MKGSNRILGLLAVATLIGVTPAQAERFGPRRECGGSNFSTCAAAEVSMVGSEVSIGPARSFRSGWGQSEERTLTLSLPSRGSGSDETYRTMSSASGCPVPSGNPLDCPTTVAPEPISMTLMATGLAGMSGMGWIRRRKLNRLA